MDFGTPDLKTWLIAISCAGAICACLLVYYCWTSVILDFLRGGRRRR